MAHRQRRPVMQNVRRFESMRAKIADDQRTTIDDAIVANLKLPAIQEIRQLTGASLAERFAKLCLTVPERFDCTEDEYWAGFYS
nr:hypothetical protein [Pirellula staleyi]